MLAPVMLLAAWGCPAPAWSAWWRWRSSVLFLANPASFTPQYKSDMRDIGGEMAPLLHSRRPRDRRPAGADAARLVLPAGRAARFANTIGPVPDPRYMNWVNALKRLQHARPAGVADTADC